MKGLKILFLFLFALISTNLFAQIQVKKTTFLPFKKDMDIAFAQFTRNTNTGDFLVIWMRTGDRVEGQLMNSTGKKISAPVILAAASDPSQSFMIFDPLVTYNPISNEYLLVYDDAIGGNRPILAVRIGSDGKPIGKTMNLTENIDVDSSHNWNPMAIFNPETGGYAVAWGHRPVNSNLDFELMALNLSADGKPGKPIIIKKSEGDSCHTALGSIPLDMAYHVPSRKLLIAYYAINPDGTETYYLATLDPLLNQAPPSASRKLIKKAIVVDQFICHLESASIAMHDNRAVIYFNTDHGILRRNINLHGRAAGKVVAALNAPVNNTELGLFKAVFSTGPAGSVGLLVAQERIPGPEWDIAHHWAQPLDSNGVQVGKPTHFDDEDMYVFAFGPLSSTSSFSTFLWLGGVYHSKLVGFPEDRGSGITKMKLTLPN
jgi:hypothetical protein